MSRLILIIAIGLGIWIVFHFTKQKVQQQGRGYLIKVALLALAGVLILAAITGKAHVIFALVGAAIPFVGRLLPLLRFWPMLRQVYNRYKSQNPGVGNQSGVRTAWLAMSLDHDSGAIDGEILDGPFLGRTLGSLSLAELQQFYSDCQRHDPDALRLLDAYAQRERAGEWEPRHNGYQNQSEPSTSAMNLAAAWDVLGLAPGASREKIVETHRKLMRVWHPDKGGSNYIASQINQAKDLLLAELEKN